MSKAVAWCALWMALLVSLSSMTVAVAQETPEQEGTRLQKQAEKLFDGGQYPAGIEIAKRALALREKALGPEHPEVATSLVTLGRLCRKAGNYELGQSTLQRALALREKILGPEHEDTARSLLYLAELYFSMRESAKAEPLYQRAQTIFERALGAEHIDTSRAFFGLANLHVLAARYDRAEPLFTRVLAIQERVLGTEGAEIATVLSNLGAMYVRMGDDARAKVVLRRSLAIREKVLGPEHADTGVSLGNLGLVYMTAGDYVDAEAVLKRALAIAEKTLGPEHIARLLGHLAALYDNIGAYGEAEPLYRRAISIDAKTQTRENQATLLNNLASMYLVMNRPEQAEPVLQQTLAIAEESLGKTHPLTTTAVGNLGRAYRLLGVYDKAESLLKRAVATSETTAGPQNRDTGDFIEGLADLYSDSSAHLKAQPLYERAIAIYEKALGPNHPVIVRALRSLAMTHWARAELSQALSLLQRVQRIQSRNSERFLAAGSEARKQDYVRTLTENTFGDVSFAMSTLGSAATVLSLTSVLQHKGRVLDAVSDNLARVRRSIAPADLQLLEQLADIATQLSVLTYGTGSSSSPEQYREQLTQLSARQQQLEAELASRSRAFSRETTPVTLANIQRAIPANAVLVEWFRYVPFDPKKSAKARRGPPRYVAYVLKRSGGPLAIDVGEARTIDTLARRLRVALADSASTDVKQHSAALSAKLMTPLRDHLQGTEHILLSPDGELNLVPMAALLDESGAYLAEHFNVSYLTSGRDLLRIADDSNILANAVVIANPDYGTRDAALSSNAQSLQPQRSADLDRSGLIFRSLAGTASEAQDLKMLLKLDDASVLLRRDASESKLKQLKSPRILHLASHGFFLSDQQLATEMRRRRGPSPAPLPTTEHPLLRSGIALAGANERRSGEDDGILTALEVTQLDLSGTELVVLSACDSGVGEVQNGEGVYGLRRALALAGAQTQVTSLWKVSDDATRHLMVEYYRRLQAGEGRAAALRSTQRAMLVSDAFSHPYYWASFIAIGNWNSLPAAK